MVKLFFHHVLEMLGLPGKYSPNCEGVEAIAVEVPAAPFLRPLALAELFALTIVAAVSAGCIAPVDVDAVVACG